MHISLNLIMLGTFCINAMDQLSPTAFYYAHRAQQIFSRYSTTREESRIHTLLQLVYSDKELAKLDNREETFKPDVTILDRLTSNPEAHEACLWMMDLSKIKREQLSLQAQYYILETEESDIYKAPIKKRWHYLDLLETALSEIKYHKTVPYYLVKEINNDTDAAQALAYLTRDLPPKNPASLHAYALAAVSKYYAHNLRKKSFYEPLPHDVGENILALSYGQYAFMLDDYYSVWRDYQTELCKNLCANEHVLQAAELTKKGPISFMIYCTDLFKDVLFKPSLMPYLIERTITDKSTFKILYYNTQEYGSPEAIKLMDAAYTKYYAAQKQ